MTTIALFDIDGTLLRAGGAGKRAIGRALADLTDLEAATTSLEGIEFAGRTDPWIIEQALAVYGIELVHGLVDRILDRYSVHLPEELVRAEAFRVLPGAHSLLRRLHTIGSLVLGLGTGNIEQAAFAKLRHARLDEFFAFGGFGCDHRDRAEILRAGFERGCAHSPAEITRVVVVGDTPHDVAAAHAIGAKCIGVCTGWFDAQQLQAAGADWVVHDLRDATVYRVLATPDLL